MPVSPAAVKCLAAIPGLTVLQNVPLAPYTRFAIGGPAAVFCDAEEEEPFRRAMEAVQDLALPRMVMGGGTNLVVSDLGFDGVVLRYTGSGIEREGNVLRAQAGAMLQNVVDRSIGFGLRGMETMTGIPGYLGGAVYGNAGAYGHSIEERLREVRVLDENRVARFSNAECQFRYRESTFKEHKDWVILSVDLEFEPGDRIELTKIAGNIRGIRDKKYPPAMKCAGSIFKNLLLRDLSGSVVAEIPPQVVREGKVPSAWFLEQTGVKGLRRGDIQVAEYHANLVYNDGSGSAADLVAVIEELKRRVRDRFGFELEEEVQYVGFEYAASPA